MNTKRLSARERLLDAAAQLFYAEGVHTVGIDRIIEAAGVAKGSLFYNFTGKDDLVAAYLAARHEERRNSVLERFEAISNPEDKLLAIFDALHESAAKTGYNGCPFANACAEAPPDGVEADALRRYRDWLTGLFADLATEAGYADPAATADRLRVIYDGAVSTSQLDNSPDAVLTAKELVRLVLANTAPAAASI